MNRRANVPAPLPPYRAMLAVDMKDFSGNASRDHGRLTSMIPEILSSAFARAGLRDEWTDRSFSRSDGDGYVAGFRSAILPFLLNPLLGALQSELEHINLADPVGTPARPIRMRVSINVGPVSDSGENRDDDGSGAARVETHRLLDAPAVKDLLARSAAATCVAAIVSARAVEDAVRAGYSGEDPTLYVPAPVQVKTYEGHAYLRVPKPSGDLLAHGFRPGVDDRPSDRDSEDTPRLRSAASSGSVSTVINANHGQVHGGVGDQINNPRTGYRKGRRNDR